MEYDRLKALKSILNGGIDGIVWDISIFFSELSYVKLSANDL